MWLGLGPLPVLQTLRDKEPFSQHGGIQKERVIVPGPGVGTGLWKFPVPTLRLPDDDRTTFICFKMLQARMPFQQG